MHDLKVVERNGGVVTAVSYDDMTLSIGSILKISKETGAGFVEEKYAVVTSISEIKDKDGVLKQVDVNLYGELETIYLHPNFGSQWSFSLQYPHQVVSMLNHLLSLRCRADNLVIQLNNLLRH